MPELYLGLTTFSLKCLHIGGKCTWREKRPNAPNEHLLSLSYRYVRDEVWMSTALC